MKSRVILAIFVFILLSFSAVAAEEVDPGILPDSPFYFIDEIFENTFVGDNPDRALEYRQEKIAEARAMSEKRNSKDAQVALKKASHYGEILEREIRPDMEDAARESAELAEEVLGDIEREFPELEGEFVEHHEQAKRISLAAEVSSKIKDLCETLAKLDPKQYAQICKSDDDSPDWLREQDERLTDDQKEHAEVFAEKLQECFESEGVECDCEGMGVKSFEDVCKRESGKAVRCRDGDQDACNGGDDDFDPADYLPDYLLPVIAGYMEDGGDHPGDYSEEWNERDSEEFQERCREQGYGTKSECLKNMRGNDEGEFDQYPQPCQDAGADTPEKCQKVMGYGQGYEREGFEGRGPPERIQEFGRDCHGLDDLEEKSKCFESFYNEARSNFAGQAFNPGDYEERYAETKERERECADMCSSQNAAWDFSGGECMCHSQYEDSDYDAGEAQKACADSCQGGAWDFSNGDCTCRFDDHSNDYDGVDYGSPEYDNVDYNPGNPADYNQPDYSDDYDNLEPDRKEYDNSEPGSYDGDDHDNSGPGNADDYKQPDDVDYDNYDPGSSDGDDYDSDDYDSDDYDSGDYNSGDSDSHDDSGSSDNAGDSSDSGSDDSHSNGGDGLTGSIVSDLPPGTTNIFEDLQALWASIFG